MDAPAADGLSRDRVLVTPTPFNTVLWRIVLLEDEHYREGFYSLLDPIIGSGRPIRFACFDRGAELEAKTAGFDRADRIREFSKGFYKLSDDGLRVRITDLRMGQHPAYAFSFVFAEHRSEPLVPIEPRRITRRLPLDEGLDWLWERAFVRGVDPPGWLPGDGTRKDASARQ